MELKVKHIFITAAFCLFSLIGHAQATHPPEPMMQDGGGGLDPCGQEDGGGTQPPVGLCLPVDDYVFPFLVLALLLGAYKVHKLDSAKTTDPTP